MTSDPSHHGRLRDLVVWGATGQARVVAEFSHDISHRIVAFVDRLVVRAPIEGVPILSGEQEFLAWLTARGGQSRLDGCIAIGGEHGAERRALARLFADHGIGLPVLVHRTAFVARDATLDEGSQVLAMARVCAGARVGRSVIINTGASVDHDCVIGDGAHIAPGAILAGEVSVEQDAMVGAGAVVLPRITIGMGAIVGAGAVVTRSVPSHQIVIGNPARVMNTR